MSKERRKPNLDLQVCYSGFKVEELEYIGYSRTTEDHEDAFLDTFPGKLDDGVASDEEDDELMGIGEFTSANISTEDYRSYLCSTPTAERKHRGRFPQEADISGFTETDYVRRSFPTNLDSGMQTQIVSAATSVGSFFGDENEMGGGSLESLSSGSRRVLRDISQQPSAMRKRIELNSEVNDPYSNVDELDLSIEEEISHVTSGNGSSSTTIGTLKRRLSLKLIRRTLSSGLFGSYKQRIPALPAPPALPTSNQEIMTNDQASLLNNKPTGPILENIWFRKFRNRHYI